MKAFATMYKFEKALADTADTDLPGTETDALALDETSTDATVKAQLAAYKRNQVAMANLTMAFQTNGLLALLAKSESTDWPNGKSTEVVKMLMKRYCPNDITSVMDLRRDLANVSMGATDDPNKMFEELAVIENKFRQAGATWTENDAMAQVLKAAPKEYLQLMTITVNQPNPSLDDLQVAMDRHYKTIRHTFQKSGGGKGDLILNTHDGGSGAKKFTGKCFHCGGTGHKINDCPKRNKEAKSQGTKSKFTGKCNHCGKVGHKAADCWLKEENANKRPTNWKRPETSNVTVDRNSSDDMVLGAMELETMSICKECLPYEETSNEETTVMSIDGDAELMDDVDTGSSLSLTMTTVSEDKIDG